MVYNRIGLLSQNCIFGESIYSRLNESKMDKTNTEVEVAGFPVLERREDWLAPLRGKSL